jgi:hypothetical protein
MHKMNRRQATAGLAASLVALTAASNNAQGMDSVRAEDVRIQKWNESEAARKKAYEALTLLANFTAQDCEKFRKAICKKQDIKEWVDKFDQETFEIFWLSGPARSGTRTTLWHGIRLSLLLGINGFALLEMEESLENMLGVMRHYNQPCYASVRQYRQEERDKKRAQLLGVKQ